MALAVRATRTSRRACYLSERFALVLATLAAKLVAQLQPRTMQPAANGSHGNSQQAGDFLVVTVFKLSQHQNCPVLRAQVRQGLLHLSDAFVTQQPLVGALRFDALPLLAERARSLGVRPRPPPAILGDQRVDRDPVQPRIKRA